MFSTMTTKEKKKQTNKSNNLIDRIVAEQMRSLNKCVVWNYNMRFVCVIHSLVGFSSSTRWRYTCTIRIGSPMASITALPSTGTARIYVCPLHKSSNAARKFRALVLRDWNSPTMVSCVSKTVRNIFILNKWNEFDGSLWTTFTLFSHFACFQLKFEQRQREIIKRAQRRRQCTQKSTIQAQLHWLQSLCWQQS